MEPIVNANFVNEYACSCIFIYIEAFMQPIRVTINQACELLNIKRTTLHLIVKQDSSFPRPIKYGATRQAPVYFDYADLVAWHKAQKAIYTVAEL